MNGKGKVWSVIITRRCRWSIECLRITSFYWYNTGDIRVVHRRHRSPAQPLDQLLCRSIESLEVKSSRFCWLVDLIRMDRFQSWMNDGIQINMPPDSFSLPNANTLTFEPVQLLIVYLGYTRRCQQVDGKKGFRAGSGTHSHGNPKVSFVKHGSIGV